MQILKLKSTANLTYLLGFLLYSINLIGTISPIMSGLSFIYILVLSCFLIFYFKTFQISRKFLIFIYLFLSLYFLSYVLHTKTEYSNYKILMLIIKATALLLIPCFIKNYENFFRGIFSALLIFVLYALFTSIFSIQNVSVNNRIDLGVLNSIWISRAVLECCLISIFILNKNWKYNVFLFLICLPTIFVSGSKGPLLAFLIVLIIYLYKISGLRTKFLYLIIFLSIIFFVAKLSKSSVWFNSDSYIVERFLSVTPESASEGIKAESRTVVWSVSTKNYLNQDLRHILFGLGVGNASKLFYGNYINSRFYPHNLLLEILFEQGLLFLLFILSFGYFLIRNNKNNFSYLLIYCFLNAMFTGDIILNEFIFFYLSRNIKSNNYFENNNYGLRTKNTGSNLYLTNS